MDSDKAISKERFKWMCRKHTSSPAEMICLDGDAKDRVMCFRCIQINSIPVKNMMSIGSILASQENDILEAYPPLKDQELSDKLRHAIIQQSLEELELYFKKLRDAFETEVKAAQQRAKAILIKKEQGRQQVLEGYIRIAEIEKLKQLIISDKEGAEKDLDEFIKDKWNKAEENRRIMSDLMSQYQCGYHFSTNEPNRIAQKIICKLKNINFFKKSIQSIIEEVDLKKSTIGTSQQLAITQIDNSIYQIKQEAICGWGQVFLDPILNPQNKYILQIELERKPGNINNCFFVGIVKDEGKDNGQAYNQSMCYYDHSNIYGITKYLKGNPMQYESTGKHSFEIRIHLEKKLLRIASLPNYSSIAELDYPNKIDSTINYRFFLAINYNGDMIRINNVSVADMYDGKM